MTQNQNFSDEEVTAYLDGEASSALVASIERQMESDLHLRQQVEALSIDKDTITKGFDDLLDLAPAAPVGQSIAANRSSSVVRWASGLAAAFLFGGISGVVLAERELDHWHEYVAAYHALYSEDTLAHAVHTDEHKEDQLSKISQALGREVDFSHALAHSNLDFTRAQVLGFQGQPLVQLAYVSPDGEPIALCVIREPGVPDSEPHHVEMEGMHATSWSHDGFSFLLIGGQDDAVIRAAAMDFRAAFKATKG